MTEIIKEGDNLPDMAIKAIVKDEIKDSKLSTLFNTVSKNSFSFTSLM